MQMQMKTMMTMKKKINIVCMMVFVKVHYEKIPMHHDIFLISKPRNQDYCIIRKERSYTGTREERKTQI